MNGSVEWRPVVGYEGYYEVSSDGQVRGIDRTIATPRGSRRLSGRVLRLKFQHYYFRTTLTKGGICTCWCVHRLVCEAFHGPQPLPTSVVRHLNGDHQDNRPENLAWGTRSENGFDMVRHGTSWWANKTQCPQGHEYNEKNTRLTTRPGGGQIRNCRECERIRAIPKNRARDQRKRELWKSRPCRICGQVFKHAQPKTRICSKSCKAASRRVAFKRREMAA